VSTPGLVFHVVNRAAKRATLFDDVGDYEAFERVLMEAIERFNVALFAYCLMPNHWHLLIQTHDDRALSRCMHWLTTTHARRWQTARGLDGLGAVYQGRFKAIPIGGDQHFLWACRYVERNALRASLVQQAEDWPWSSLCYRHAESKSSWLSEWPLAKPGNWVAHVNRLQTDGELEAFRKAMTTGEPFGDEEWRRVVKDQMGIGPKRPRGRPCKHTRAPVLIK
jgi:putative transposase